MAKYPRVASLKTVDDFRGRLNDLDLRMPVQDRVEPGPDSVLAQPATVNGVSIGNRFCILPMEGWDGTTDGRPTELTRRRWQNFGISGAKLIWGGEAVAVRHDGRANPNQLCMQGDNANEVAELHDLLIHAHQERFGDTEDLLVGLQLTHSGRYARPNQKAVAEPRAVQRNPALDDRVGVVDSSGLISDDELKSLIEDFVRSAVEAQKIGFRFVDVKHCHGYLGHELLSGMDRPGPFGGSFENRTRFLREIVAGIRAEAPGLEIGVRFSLFDFVPFVTGDDSVGTPDQRGDSRLHFGCTRDGLGIDLETPVRFVQLLDSLGIRLICTTAGSPYSTPHLQRPAFFPPSDGYQPPEDPLVGVDRQILATAALKQQCPDAFIVGSGYTYLQDWIGHVGQAVVDAGMADSIGLGRMVLSYPDLPADIIAGTQVQRKRICRTFSDCTTAPRKGMISGCYPLDPFYKQMPERTELAKLKKESINMV